LPIPHLACDYQPSKTRRIVTQRFPGVGGSIALYRIWK